MAFVPSSIFRLTIPTPFHHHHRIPQRSPKRTRPATLTLPTPAPRTALVLSVATSQTPEHLHNEVCEWLRAWLFHGASTLSAPVSYIPCGTLISGKRHLNIHVDACILPNRSRIQINATSLPLPGERRILRELVTHLRKRADVAILYKPRHVRLRAQTPAALVAYIDNENEAKIVVRNWAQRSQFAAISPALYGASAVLFRHDGVDFDLAGVLLRVRVRGRNQGGATVLARCECEGSSRAGRLVQRYVPFISCAHIRN